MDATVTLIIALIALLAAALLWAWSRQGAKRSTRLRERFGPEYERAIARSGSRERGEQELLGRMKRSRQLAIVPLTPAQHDEFLVTWTQVQKQFVDEPIAAVRRADQLVAEVMLTRGFPASDPEQRAADLSVDHPELADHYRAARDLADPRQGQATTEQLRQAFVRYRVLFADLLETAPATESRAPIAWQPKEVYR